MQKLIVFIILALTLTVFATSNAAPVSILFATYAIQIPLSLALIAPVGISLLIFTVVYLTKTARMHRARKHVEQKLKDSEAEVLETAKRIHALELENKSLKTRLGEQSYDEESL